MVRDGVPQDNAEALRWFRLGADQSFAPAQMALLEHSLNAALAAHAVGTRTWSSENAAAPEPISAHLSIRSGVLHFSIGVYNDQVDIDPVIAVARQWRDTTGYAR